MYFECKLPNEKTAYEKNTNAFTLRLIFYLPTNKIFEKLFFITE